CWAPSTARPSASPRSPAASGSTCFTFIRPWPGRGSAPCSSTRWSGSPAAVALRGLLPTSVTARSISSAAGAFRRGNAIASRSAASGWRTPPWTSSSLRRSARNEPTRGADPVSAEAPHRGRDRRHRGRHRAGAQLLPLVTRSGAQAMEKPDPPFPKHWLYYIVLKYAVIAAAVVIALYVASQFL